MQRKNMVFHVETMDHPTNIILPWRNGTSLGWFSPCRAEFIRPLAVGEQAQHHCQGQQRLRHWQAGVRREGVQGTATEYEKTIVDLGSIRLPEYSFASGLRSQT